jgi:hypothetical protein
VKFKTKQHLWYCPVSPNTFATSMFARPSPFQPPVSILTLTNHHTTPPPPPPHLGLGSRLSRILRSLPGLHVSEKSISKHVMSDCVVSFGETLAATSSGSRKLTPTIRDTSHQKRGTCLGRFACCNLAASDLTSNADRAYAIVSEWCRCTAAVKEYCPCATTQSVYIATAIRI